MIGCFGIVTLALTLLALLGIFAWAWPLWGSWFAGISAFLCLLFSLVGYMTRAERVKAAELLQAEHEFLRPLARRTADGAAGERSDYFEQLVTINVSNLREYYFLVKSHTQKSFRVSLGAGVMGFLLIVSASTVSLFGQGPDNLTELGIASGVFIEFISAIFFYLYNKTVRQLKEYHDSLLEVQNLLLALKLVENLENTGERERVIVSLLNALLTRSSASIRPDKIPEN